MMTKPPVERTELVFTDADDTPLYREVRTDAASSKSYFQERFTKWGWKSGLDDVDTVPFNLPAITNHPDRSLYLVEGAWSATFAQRAADKAGIEVTFTAVTNGAKGWKLDYAVVLARAGVTRIAVIPDEDENGISFAEEAATDLYGVGIDAVIVELSSGDLDPEHLLDEGHDIVDWIEAYGNGYGRTPGELLTLLAEQREYHDVWTDDDDETEEIDTMLNRVTADHDWLMPGQFEHGDRLIVTGGEGAGKTTLLRQMGMCAASGLNSFDTTQTFDPVPALIIDLENSKAQVSREFRPLRERAGERLLPGMLFVEGRGESIDLMSEWGQNWLERKVARRLPAGGLLLMGPLYKMMDGDMSSDRDSKVVTDFLDYLRRHYGLAIVLEGHTKHPSQQGRTLHRQFGSRHWVRWPEFGFHLSKSGLWTPWRDPRDASRVFPTRFERGNLDIGDWPWVGTVSDDALRFRRCVTVAQKNWSPGDQIPGARKVLTWLTDDIKAQLEATGSDSTTIAVERALESIGISKKILEGLIGSGGTMRDEWEATFQSIENEVAEARYVAETVKDQKDAP